MDCIFCKIAAKTMKAALVRETGSLVVIKDINPQAPVHLLVIPKRHHATLLDGVDAALLGEMVSEAAKAAIDAGVDKSGFRCVINTNEEGGQTVMHLHMHVLGGRPLVGRMG